MKTIVHISDIHFGTEEPAIVEALIEDIGKADPGLVALSGDLTQRARSSQFKAARAFLEKLNTPYVVVPGNHDIPLYNLYARLLHPLKKYEHYITDDPLPVFENNAIYVAGISSVRHKRWKSGKLRDKELEQMLNEFAATHNEKLKVLVLHHNLFYFPLETRRKKIERAEDLINLFSSSGIDLILFGHDHKHLVKGLPESASRRYKAILIQAGTAISHRTRKEPNSYNIIRYSGGTLNITTRSFTGNGFTTLSTEEFTSNGDFWVHVKK